MKCRRVPLEADVFKFELGKGLEDGYELYSDVITKTWIVASNLVQITRPDGSIVCPYISHRRGKTFIRKEIILSLIPTAPSMSVVKTRSSCAMKK